MNLIQWIIAVVIAGVFIWRSWSHLDTMRVPKASWDILFAVLGGVYIGLILVAVIIFIFGRNNS